MRILVFGGRTFGEYVEGKVSGPAERTFLVRSLNDVFEPGDVLIHGGAPGADILAARWACLMGYEAVCFKADWPTHGKAAGPMRNQRMIDEGRPDLALAFPGGKGTADMTRRLEKAGIPVYKQVMPILAYGTKP